jgi:hypothetical protein
VGAGHEVSWEIVGVFAVREGRIAECRPVPFDQRGVRPGSLSPFSDPRPWR